MCNKMLGVFSEYTSDTTQKTIRLTVTGEEGFSWSAVVSAPCASSITTLALRKFRSEHKGVNVTFLEKVVPDAERDALISNEEMMDLL